MPSAVADFPKNELVFLSCYSFTSFATDTLLKNKVPGKPSLEKSSRCVCNATDCLKRTEDVAGPKI